MITLYPTEEEILEAQSEASRTNGNKGHLNGSVMKGGGTVHGLLAEIVICNNSEKFFRTEKFFRESKGDIFSYDFDIVDMQSGLLYDAKTKLADRPPSQHYNCTIYNFNTQQDCDKYIFTRVKKDFSEVWVIGDIDKDSFFEKATFGKKGDTDPTYPRYTYPDDCYNITISSLDRINMV